LKKQTAEDSTTTFLTALLHDHDKENQITQLDLGKRTANKNSATSFF
jgi:hypothetical protein